MKISYSEGAIRPEEVIHYLVLNGQANAVFREIIRNKEVTQKARQLNIEASDEELQQYANTFRLLNGLHSAEETLRFLKNSGLTEDDFESFCEASLLTSKLKDHFGEEEKIAEYFVNNRSELESVEVSGIQVEKESLAEEIMIQVQDEGEDFHALARKYSTDEATKHSGGYMGAVARSMLPPEVAAKLFSSEAGDLRGPFPINDRLHLFLIEGVTTAELTEHAKEVIKDRLFEEWVSDFFKGGLRIDP